MRVGGSTLFSSFFLLLPFMYLCCRYRCCRVVFDCRHYLTSHITTDYVHFCCCKSACLPEIANVLYAVSFTISPMISTTTTKILRNFPEFIVFSAVFWGWSFSVQFSGGHFFICHCPKLILFSAVF